MAKSGGAIRSRGEYINHFNGIRLRVLGAGNLQLKLLSEGDGIDSASEEQELVPLVMASATNIQPMRLANFRQQRMQIEIKTTAINEIFKITRLIVYSKAVATSYPGN